MTEFLKSQFNLQQLEFLIRIILAGLCGFLIGLERKKRYKDAGIRTHLILSMGCCILVIISKYGFIDSKDLGLNVDASRVASNIATGIGFLGAGVIFVRNGSVRGLTTAAGIWATAAIAMAIGAGLYFIGIASTILLLLIQILLYRLFPNLEGLEVCEVVVKVKPNTLVIDDIKEEIRKEDIYINTMKVKKTAECTEIRMSVKIHKEHSFENLLATLAANENITEITTNF